MTMDFKRIHPTNNYSQNMAEADRLNNEMQKTDGNTFFRQIQSTNPNFTKGPLSYVPSEANPSPYTIIEKNKLHYIDLYNKFVEMRFVEQLAGLKQKQEKLELLEAFYSMFDDMLACLSIIQSTIFAINFDSPDFQSNFSMHPQTMIDLVYKDIKTLEGFHIEMVYSSSLRYLDTVLEALEFDPAYAARLTALDIKDWSQKTINHLFMFKASPRGYKAQKIKPTCLQKMCPCFYKANDTESNVSEV